MFLCFLVFLRLDFIHFDLKKSTTDVISLTNLGFSLAKLGTHV